MQQGSLLEMTVTVRRAKSGGIEAQPHIVYGSPAQTQPWSYETLLAKALEASVRMLVLHLAVQDQSPLRVPDDRG